MLCGAAATHNFNFNQNIDYVNLSTVFFYFGHAFRNKNFVSTSRLTGECATQKLKKIAVLVHGHV